MNTHNVYKRIRAFKVLIKCSSTSTPGDTDPPLNKLCDDAVGGCPIIYEMKQTVFLVNMAGYVKKNYVHARIDSINQKMDFTHEIEGLIRFCAPQARGLIK